MSADKSKKSYEVVADGFILGQHYKAGDRVELHPRQAQYDLPPHGTMLRDPDAPVEAEAAPQAASEPKRRAKGE